MKTRLTIPGLKEILLPAQARRARLFGSSRVARALFGAVEPAERPVGLDEFLRTVVLFERLDRRELRRLARIVHEREYRDGEYVCEEGKPGAALFMLRRGTVEVLRRAGDGAAVSLALLEPPASFEESAAMGTEAVHCFSIRARGPVSILALGRPDLEAMTLHFPVLANKVLMKVASVLATRLQLVLEARELLDSDARPEAER